MLRSSSIVAVSLLVLSVSPACSKSKPKTTPDTTITDTGMRPGKTPTGTADTGDGDTSTTPGGSERVGFGPVYFEFDSSMLSSAGRDELDRLSSQLAAGTARVAIEGHTDDRGTTEYNLALGQQRANTVAEYLRRLGVASARIDTITYGEERPADGGDGESAWAKNRRAELVVGK